MKTSSQGLGAQSKLLCRLHELRGDLWLWVSSSSSLPPSLSISTSQRFNYFLFTPMKLCPRYACRPLPSLATQSLASLVTQEGEHELLEEPVEERQEVSLLQLWESFVVWNCIVVKIWSLTHFEPGRELSLLGIILMLLLFLRYFQ